VTPAVDPTTAGSRWSDLASHRSWLLGESFRLLDFFRATVGPDGCFVELDDDGRAMPTGCPPATEPRQSLLTVARAVHCYALGELLGVPGSRTIVARGLDVLWSEHRDRVHGGYVEATGRPSATVATKSAYGHAFVLLAASSGIVAGHDVARQIYDDVLEVIGERFWSDADGASREAFSADWDELEDYRGANSNMHLCEAFLAASDATGDAELAGRAARIARLLIDDRARANAWLLPEHYDSSWRADLEYNRDRPDHPFRPYGVTIGHLLEWSRLVLSTWIATGRSDTWLVEAAAALFDRAVTQGWDEVHGGFVYTIDWDGAPVNDDHYWWPVAEGIGASAYLATLVGAPTYEIWYRRLWDFASDHLIDHGRGGWYAQLDASNHRTVHPWYGKPDLYHALQACLLPLVPPAPGLAAQLGRDARGVT